MKKLILLLLFITGFTLYSQEASVNFEYPGGELQPGRTYQIIGKFQFPEGFHQTLQKEYFYISLPDSPEQILLGELIYPDGKKEKDIINYYESADLIQTFTVKKKFQFDEITIEYAYQLCDEEGVCYLPVRKTVDLKNDIISEQLPSGRSNLSFLLLILMAFAGGLILNIMPCVLPLLSVKALNLINQSRESRKSLFFRSLAYASGIITSMLFFGIMIVILKKSGEFAGWGFQFQNPLFVLFLTIIFLVFSLSLFDLFVINAAGSTMKTAQKASGAGGYTGSFMTGVFAVLVATPCTAPFLGAAMGFAFSQTTSVILLFMSVAGLGFSLPFLLLGIFPGIVRKLPKPGAWMNTFKFIMGFFMTGMMIHLLLVLQLMTSHQDFAALLWFMFTLTFMIWASGHVQKNHYFKYKTIILSLIVIVTFITSYQIFLGREWGQPPVQSNEVSSLKAGWETFSPELVQTYRDEGTPVFLVFSAEWCLTCKTNEKTLLHTDRFEKLMNEKGVKLVYGDYTRSDPVIGSWIEQFQRSGVPLYAWYAPGKKAELLPELLYYSQFKSLTDKLPESTADTVQSVQWN